MTKRPKKLPRDVNARAVAIGKIATGSVELPEESAKASGQDDDAGLLISNR